MKAFKSAAADVKETVQNTVAKADEKVEINKASKVAKAEKKAADDKAGKHEAKGNYYAKQAEIRRDYDQKKANNAAEKEQKKVAAYQKGLDKHTNKVDAIGGDSAQNQTNSDPASS